MSKLYFTYSAMNAGKSAILLQAAHNYGERGMSAMLWTSVHHAADPGARTGQIESRIGLKAPARIFAPETDLLQRSRRRPGLRRSMLFSSMKPNSSPPARSVTWPA